VHKEDKLSKNLPKAENGLIQCAKSPTEAFSKGQISAKFLAEIEVPTKTLQNNPLLEVG
jgi:hypothetical protein